MINCKSCITYSMCYSRIKELLIKYYRPYRLNDVYGQQVIEYPSNFALGLYISNQLGYICPKLKNLYPPTLNIIFKLDEVKEDIRTQNAKKMKFGEKK